MKRHLNTLFVMTEGAYLRKDGQAVVVRVEKENRLRVPLHNLDGIVCFGKISCSPYLMAACAEAGVTISFLSPYGGFRAAVVGFTPGNVLLRRAQYRMADDESAVVVLLVMESPPRSPIHVRCYFVVLGIRKTTIKLSGCDVLVADWHTLSVKSRKRKHSIDCEG